MRIYASLFGRIKCSAFAVTVEPADTVGTAKAKFFVNPSLSTTLRMTDGATLECDDWMLLLRGARLPEDQTLASCGVEDGTVVSLMQANAATFGLLEAAREFHSEGCVFPVLGMLGPDRLEAADALLTSLVGGRPENLAPEDLLNLHLTTQAVFDLCRAPECLAMARAMLGTDDVSIFTSRILCKLPGTGKEIVWHQDSNYWPLIPPGRDEICPEVASLWLALDDVSEENGSMQVLPFSACPQSRGRNATEFLLDAGGSTQGFDNFNLSLDISKMDVSACRRVDIRRGEAEWHSAWTCHRSDPNGSDRRRLAWIVRYIPTGTRVVPGMRGSFGEDYPLVPVCGQGAASAAPMADAGDPYAVCFGNAATNAALKK